MFTYVSNVMSLENPCASDIEQSLFWYAGYYPVEMHRDDDGSVVRVKYAVVHTKYAPVHKEDREYPVQLDVSTDDVELYECLELDMMSETVKISGSYDMKLVQMIQDLLKSYGY